MTSSNAARPAPSVSGNGSLEVDRYGGLISNSKHNSVNQADLRPELKPSNKHWYAYDVKYGGVTIVTNSRDQEHDLARALLARGVHGLVQVIDSKTGETRNIVNVDAAAKFSTDSNLRTRSWKAFETCAVDGYSPEEFEPLVRVPGTHGDGGR